MGNTVGRQFCISLFQKEVINGCLLGDGRLECRSREGSARLRIHHGWRQKELIFWKYKVLKNLVSCPPRKIVCWKNPKNSENYYSWYFHTLTLIELKDFHQKFYQGKKKRLPQEIFEILTPVSLAVWIMDDGCYDRGSLILNTHHLTLEGNKIIQKVLKRKFNLSTGINKDRNHWRLRFLKSEFQKLKNLIEPFLIHSMRYKIVPVETESIKTR
jgi:hypothetical protein